MSDSGARLPALFIAHGSPMNALPSSRFGQAWQQLGRTLPRPRAIVSVSAHWYTSGTWVTQNATPKTIHDFGGFSPALYEISYPAPGDPELALQLVERLAAVAAQPSSDWGLDHGTWSVLVHIYPNADIPVVQLSIDATQPAAFHYALGQQLAPLRDQGVLILGSGGIVHNLARLDWSDREPPPQWARNFDVRVCALALAGDHPPLIQYQDLGPDAQLAVPTPDHYLPLLYVLGAQQPGEPVSVPVSGFELGTISMSSVVVGTA